MLNITILCFLDFEKSEKCVLFTKQLCVFIYIYVPTQYVTLYIHFLLKVETL